MGNSFHLLEFWHIVSLIYFSFIQASSSLIFLILIYTLVLLISQYESICYFVMGTEVRLISQQKESIDQEASQQQLRLSKLYHLFSIKVVSTLVSCESKYLGHLLNSLKTHYNLDLYQDQKSVNEQVSTIEIQAKQSYQAIQICSIQERMKSQKYNIQNKTNTIFMEPTRCDIQNQEQILSSPKGKMKNKKKSLPKANKSGSKYTFPKVKHLSGKGQFNTSKSRQAKRRQIRNSRNKKINQEYFIQEEKKKVLKSRKRAKNYSARSKSKETSIESKGQIGLRTSRQKNIYLKPTKKDKKK